MRSRCDPDWVICLQFYPLQCFRHRLQWGATAVDAERDRSVFMPGYSFDQRVLHTSVPQVVNESVAETMERLSRVGDAQFGLVPTKPLRRCMAQLPPHGLQFGKQAICSGGPDCYSTLNQSEIGRAHV